MSALYPRSNVGFSADPRRIAYFDMRGRRAVLIAVAGSSVRPLVRAERACCGVDGTRKLGRLFHFRSHFLGRLRATCRTPYDPRFRFAVIFAVIYPWMNCNGLYGSLPWFVARGFAQRQ